MAITKLMHIKEAKDRSPSAHLKNAIQYIVNPKKTQRSLWIGGNVGRDPDKAYRAMLDTKEDFGKLYGRQGYHFVISFSPGEVDPETAYLIGREFCQRYLGDGFDYIFAVHNDQAHCHCHIVFNSVNRMNGGKYRYANGDWAKTIQPITDEICRQRGLPPLTYDHLDKKGKSYAERRAEKEGRITGKQMIQADMDAALEKAGDYEDYLRNLQKMGYQIHQGYSQTRGAYLTYHAPGMKKGRRDYNLGSGYSLAEIKQRIEQSKNLGGSHYGGKEVSEKEAREKELGEKETGDGQTEERKTGGRKFIERDGEARQNMYLPKRLQMQRLWSGSKVGLQRSYAIRVIYAVNYRHLDLTQASPAQVHQDLLQIHKLQEECSYLLDHHLTATDQVRNRMEAVKSRERELRIETGKGGDSHELKGVREEKGILRRILKREEQGEFRNLKASQEKEIEDYLFPHPTKRLEEPQWKQGR